MSVRFFVICSIILAVAACDNIDPKDSAASPAPLKMSTASASVSVLPFAFLIDGLDRQRTIRLYLPPDYTESTDSYPVLYMHDGQNLFDAASSYAGEWGVDETLDGLAQAAKLKLIVVGIDNGGEYRMNELSPWPNKRFGEAQGKQYMDFIVEVVKPYIDTNYRTKPERQHTAIMGSSMGALISHYAIHAYPQVFSKAGLFSPSYWYSDSVFDYTQEHKVALDARLYVMFGDEEGDGMIVDTGKMQRQLLSQGHPRELMVFKRVAGGEHNEALWRQEFADAVQWLFSE
ncbi:MAG: alpha/beta hydrolase [Paraglaciecola sp.]|nr:alpha/beta hydrolase [Paraglaciecola sp.]NCT47441.1 alpha/beta hydrolase [Paraglaciecola sp.]